MTSTRCRTSSRKPLEVLGWDPHERAGRSSRTRAYRERKLHEVRLLDARLRRLAAQHRGRGHEASWDYVRRLTQRSEEMGWDLTLIAELNLNDIKGVEEPALDAWSTAAALAAVTDKIELMVAVRPNFHHPALFAKQAANIDNIAGGRLALNVVSSWWADEATQYGLQFDQHDDRYARTSEWLTVVDGLWTQDRFSLRRRALHAQGRDLRAQAGRQAAADDLRRRRKRGGQDDDRAPVRRLCHARRRGRGDRGEDRRHGSAPRGDGAAADAIRHGRLRHRPRQRGRGEARARADHRSMPPTPPKGFDNFDQWLSGTAARARAEAAGILRVEPRPAPEPGRHARAGCANGSRNMPRSGSTCCCSR